MAKRSATRRAMGVAAAVAIASLPLVSGCTAMASREQLQMLAEARKAEVAAVAELNACRQQNADIERQLTKRRQVLAKLRNDRDTVQKALNK